jgi:hypothetical protein
MDDLTPNERLGTSVAAFDTDAPSKVVELDTGSICIVSRHGGVYDFTPWRNLDPIVPLITAAFGRNLSRNRNKWRAKNIDSSTATKLRKFLTWWTVNPHPFGRFLLLDYKHYLLGQYAAITVWNDLQSLNAILKDLMDRGDIPRFALPPNVSQTAALAEGAGGQTLAHMLPAGFADNRSFAELNKAILFELKQFCWENIRRFEATFAQGRTWRDEARGEAFDLDELARPDREWTYQEALETTVKLIWKHCDGFYPLKMSEDEQKAAVARFLWVMRKQKQISRKRQGKNTPDCWALVSGPAHGFCV